MTAQETLTAVKNRLSQLKYTPADSDDALINYIIVTVSNKWLELLNVKGIPEQFDNIMIDKIAAAFLREQLNLGLTDKLSVVLDQVVTQVKTGDTDVRFTERGMTPERRYRLALDILQYGCNDALYTLRRMRW